MTDDNNQETAAAAAPATNVFDKHVQEENEESHTSGVQITWKARLAVFLGFPLVVGFGGLYVAYLETIRKPERELSMEIDFIMPFLLALAFAVVVGFQTKGYSTNKVEPLVKWPKVIRKKVIRKVKKGDLDENGELIEEVEEKDPATKKDE